MVYMSGLMGNIAFCAFVGAYYAQASKVAFGEAMFDPTVVLYYLDNKIIVLIAFFILQAWWIYGSGAAVLRRFRSVLRICQLHQLRMVLRRRLRPLHHPDEDEPGRKVIRNRGRTRSVHAEGVITQFEIAGKYIITLLR